MSKEYLNQTRLIQELEALIERDQVAAVNVAKTELAREVDVAARKIEETAETSIAVISAQTEIAVTQITENMEHASARMMANTERSISIFGNKTSAQAQGTHAETTKAMVAKIAYIIQKEFTAIMISSVESIRLDAMRAIGDVQKAAADSINEIKHFAEQAEITINRKAKSAADRLLTIMDGDKTPEALVSEAERAAQEILDAAKVASALLKNTVDACVARITVQARDSEKRISTLADTAKEKIVGLHKKASDRIIKLVLIRSPT